MPTKAYNQVLAMTESPSEKTSTMAKVLISNETSMEDKLRAWHTAMDQPVRTEVSIIPVKDVERRLRLTLEEYLETVKASGFTIVSKATGRDIFHDLKLIPLEHGEQDLIEIADGIGDQLVTNLGHAIEHGFPITAIFNEIMLSNATKLPMDGIPIVNRCIVKSADPENHVCGKIVNTCVLLDHNSPVGKVLKPSSYIKADISTVIEEYNNSK